MCYECFEELNAKSNNRSERGSVASRMSIYINVHRNEFASILLQEHGDIGLGLSNGARQCLPVYRGQ